MKYYASDFLTLKKIFLLTFLDLKRMMAEFIEIKIMDFSKANVLTLTNTLLSITTKLLISSLEKLH